MKDTIAANEFGYVSGMVTILVDDIVVLEDRDVDAKLTVKNFDQILYPGTHEFSIIY